jgi:hypothetical protein
VERAADASRQLGDTKNFRRLLEEIRCQLHSKKDKALKGRVKSSTIVILSEAKNLWATRCQAVLA